MCCLCILTAPLAAAGEIALGFTGGTEAVAGYSTLGWSFVVSEPIVVTHLGLYAASSELVNSHQVAIWAEGGSLLVTGTVASGGGAGWHWTSVTGTSLGAGSYVIGASYAANTDVDWVVFNASSVSMGSGLSYGQNRYYVGSGFNRPDGTLFLSDNSFFGPNFQYGPAMVPEPALLQLPFLIAAGGAGLWWRSRKRRVHD